MRYEIQPLGDWTGPVTAERRRSQFRASWSDTLNLLGIETYNLGADLVVMQLDVVRGEIRRDGMIRAGAKVGSPAVRVSFTSTYGPLTYATDRFDTWQDNIRAIALALVALRAVDRYGVNGRGEQYTGWLAIESGPSAVEAARALLESYGGEKAAVKATHPDKPGNDPVAFLAVQQARELLAGETP